MLEFSQFDNAKDHKLSYSIAVLIFILSFAFILIPVHYFKYRNGAAIDTRYFAEIYDGIKDNTASKLFFFIFILRRFLMVAVIVFMRNANIWARCICFTLIQITVLFYTIIVRPFEKIKDNMIELVNEITFAILCIIIVVCNDESRWVSSLDSVLIYFLMFVGLLIGAIISIELIIS